MAVTRPRYSKEEFARRGEEICERQVRPHVGGRDKNEVVAIDIESGTYEIDANEDVAADRLTARVPDARIWVRRVGFPYVRHFGGRGLSGAK